MRRGSRLAAAAAAAAAATACVVVGASPGQAAPRVPGADPVALVLDAGDFCSFEIALVLRDGQRPVSGNGSVRLTGPFAAELTNTSTGRSVTLNVSGPTLVDRRSGATVMTGTSLVGQPASRDVGEAFLRLYRGRVVFTDQNTVASARGSVVDLCALLG